MKKRKLVLILLISVIVGAILFQEVKSKVMSWFIAEMMKKPPAVELVEITEDDIYEKVESAGRIQAKYSVNIVARISGWLEKSYFKEGAKVQKGQLLFLIEPDKYRIAVQDAQAAVRQSKAALVNSEKELVRAAELVKKDFVSKSYYDKALATQDQNRAMYDVNIAKLNQAKLNYSYTHVKSPVDGKIGKIIITQGNLVNEQSGTIATVVSTNPIYAYFNLKSEEYLKFKKDTNANPDLSNMKVQIKLADGSIYPEEGTVEFVDNAVNPSAGTIELRASFKNPNDVLVPNDYINVVASLVKPHKVTLVPQSAVLDSPDGYYVWVIDDKLIAHIHHIKISTQYKDYWIVTEGLKAGDKVVGKGLLKLKPDIKVEIKTAETDETQNKDSKNK